MPRRNRAVAENTKIEWTRRIARARQQWGADEMRMLERIGAWRLADGRWSLPGFTWNHWRGCTKVSDACLHCYAETLAGRNPAVLGGWGPGAPRVKASGPYEKFAPHKWNRWARRLGVRFCVFALSLGDWLDAEAPAAWLAELLRLIHDTPRLDWLLLTKRPENWNERLAGVQHETQLAFDWFAMGRPPANVAIGITAENQGCLENRLPHLLAIPARWHFLSCEPLLGPLDVSRVPLSANLGEFVKTPRTEADLHCFPERITARTDGIDWIISGGESGGAESRPSDPAWHRSLRDACAASGTHYFFKQWGDWLPAGMNAAHLPRERGYKGCELPGGQFMLRCGKAAAGSLLDGARHTASPFHETQINPQPPP